MDMDLYTYVCTVRTYVPMHTCMLVRMYVCLCMYIFMYVCMYYMQIFTRASLPASLECLAAGRKRRNGSSQNALD
jgi:hypothetical protein